jgi:hypothetical protein
MFSKSPLFDEPGQAFDVGRQQHRIVQQLLVAIVAEDSGLTFGAPGALREDAISNVCASVSGPTKEALRNVVML